MASGALLLTLTANLSLAGGQAYTNVAEGKSCMMSAELNSYDCNHTINGDTSTSYTASNCVQTNDTSARWDVALGYDYDISNITIYGVNATDDNSSFARAAVSVNGRSCGELPSSQAGNLSTPVVVCSNITASNVSITVDDSTINGSRLLGLCEVQVWAVCTSGTYGPPGCTACGNCFNNQPCDKTTGACTRCAPGYDHTADNKCKQECSPGKFGLDCGRDCSVNCNPSRQCNPISGTCICQPGFKPGTCTTPCDNGQYSQDCGQTCGQCANNSPCNKQTGACTACQPGYNHTVDNTCKTPCRSGTYGDRCSQTCSSHCSGVCDKSTGHCTCDAGYQEPNCRDACAAGRWGSNCTNSCGSFCRDTCNHVTGHCECKPGYKIPFCSSACDAGRYGQNCSQTCGSCNAGSKTCNHVTGECSRCVDNREMPLCQDCIAGQWGPTCGQRCGQCGGDGRCHEVSGVCLSGDCQDGWRTPTCDVKCDDGRYGTNCSKECGHCKDNSFCRHDNGVCEQDCEDGYEGVLCLSEKESLEGAIVGSVMGAGILIALAVIGAMFFYMRRVSTDKKDPHSSLGNELTGAASTETYSSRDSQVYQNVGRNQTSRDNPCFDNSYDPLNLNRANSHSYALHSPPGKNGDQAGADPPYQNTREVVSPQKTAPGLAGKKQKKMQHNKHMTAPAEGTYGNINDHVSAEGPYGNLKGPQSEGPYGNV